MVSRSGSSSSCGDKAVINCFINSYFDQEAIAVWLRFLIDQYHKRQQHSGGETLTTNSTVGAVAVTAVVAEVKLCLFNGL